MKPHDRPPKRRQSYSRHTIVKSAAAIVSPSCPLWVKSGHPGTFNQCPLYPQKQTLGRSRAMSALCQKQTFALYFAERISRSTGSRRVASYDHQIACDDDFALEIFRCGSAPNIVADTVD